MGIVIPKNYIFMENIRLGSLLVHSAFFFPDGLRILSSISAVSSAERITLAYITEDTARFYVRSYLKSLIIGFGACGSHRRPQIGACGNAGFLY